MSKEEASKYFSTKGP